MFSLLWRRLKRVCRGFDTPYEFVLLLIDHIYMRLFKVHSGFRLQAVTKRIAPAYKKSEFYLIKDVKIPLLEKKMEEEFFGYVFEDTFYFYITHADCYNECLVDKYLDVLIEGPYGLKNDKIDVQIFPGDVVFDVGSWIGDFAAYASTKGAVSYAFEPIGRMFEYLRKTALLNPNIIPVQQGLGSKDDVITVFVQEYTLGSTVFQRDSANNGCGERISITTVDEFVKKHKIGRVDFIKADIEGYERYMLEGAQEVLRRFAPKLALCTYHLPDDPVVLADLIKKANPEYHIVQKKKKLYASVIPDMPCE